MQENLLDVLRFDQNDLPDNVWCGEVYGDDWIDDCVFEEAVVVENTVKIVFDNLDEPDGEFDPCLCVENELCKIGPEDDVYRCGHHCHEQIILDLCPDFLNSKCEPSDCDAGALAVAGDAEDYTEPK